MTNKLKKIFNNNTVQNTINIAFDDINNSKEFRNLLNRLWETGEPQKICGVKTLTTGRSDGIIKYTKDEITYPIELMIYPIRDEKTFLVETRYGIQELTMYCYSIKDGFVFETKEDFPVACKITLCNEKHKCEIIYSFRVSVAKDAYHIASAYGVLYEFLNKLVIVDTLDPAYDSWEAMCNRFKTEIDFFNMVYELEKELNVKCSIEYMQNASEDEWRECVSDIKELHYTLIQKKALRLAAKLSSTETTGVYLEKNEPIEEGKKIELTFTGSAEYNLFGKKIKLFSANLLTNAIVKKIIREEDNRIKILYGDTDSNPMYISYTIHLTEEEAVDEASKIMEHSSSYIEADYLRE